MSRIRSMTPEDVATYAQQDNLALSEVKDNDLLDELSARLLEYDFLTRQRLWNRIKEIKNV
jgi:hypothetical protein